MTFLAIATCQRVCTMLEMHGANTLHVSAIRMNYHVKDHMSLHSNGPFNGMFSDHIPRDQLYTVLLTSFFAEEFFLSAVKLHHNQCSSLLSTYIFRNAETVEEVDSIFSCDITFFNPSDYLLYNVFLLMQRKLLLFAIITHTHTHTHKTK